MGAEDEESETRLNKFHRGYSFPLHDYNWIYMSRLHFSKVAQKPSARCMIILTLSLAMNWCAALISTHFSLTRFPRAYTKSSPRRREPYHPPVQLHHRPKPHHHRYYRSKRSVFFESVCTAYWLGRYNIFRF